MFLLADTPPYAYVSWARKTTCQFSFLIFYNLEAANLLYGEMAKEDLFVYLFLHHMRSSASYTVERVREGGAR
jgi:hypothetical protein